MSGFYTNETELARDAVRRMREEKECASRLQEAVVRDIQAVERGETVALTPDLLQEIKQDATARPETTNPKVALMPHPKTLKLELLALAKDDLSDIAQYTFIRHIDAITDYSPQNSLI